MNTNMFSAENYVTPPRRINNANTAIDFDTPINDSIELSDFDTSKTSPIITYDYEHEMDREKKIRLSSIRRRLF